MATKHQLYEELDALESYQIDCDELVDLIEHGSHQLDLSSDMSTVTAAILNVLSDSISRRTTELSQLSEAEKNQTMDRFVRKQV